MLTYNKWPYRRWFLTLLTSFIWLGITGACTVREGKEKERGQMVTRRNQYNTGRLTARPRMNQAKEAAAIGLQPLQLDNKRDGFIYVPKNYRSNEPAALAVMLHGAGGQAEHGLSLLRQYADDQNLILIAPVSRAVTWDIIANNAFGPDVIYLDQALNFVFERYNIDAGRIALGGFSDGASYALCLGLTNGDLFTHIISFSPGFAYTLEQVGKPAVYVSHGTRDQVLPIGPCSRRVVPQLQRQGILVNYLEFEGAHEIPIHISKSAIAWFFAKQTR